MSPNPPQPHGPTHSTRRGRQVSGGESNFLYKLIMVFNLVMTFVTTCANEHIVENQSTVSPNQTEGQKMIMRSKDIGDGYRRTVFSLIIILYSLSAVAVLVLNFPTSDGIAKKILSVIEDLLLLLAGILYLSGDNILLLHRRFEATIGVTEAKDVRSYVVAISLALMVMSKIIPYMKKTVDDYGKPSQTLEVSHNGKNKTWEIRSEEVIAEIDVTIIKKELVDGKQRKMCNCCYYPPCKRDKRAYYPQEQEKKQDRQKLRLSMKGTSDSPEIEINNESSSWKDTFRITHAQFNVDSDDQPNENHVQTRVLQNTAMIFLFDVYVYLIDYTLIADALYTTVLDEITHQDRNIAEGYDCPKGHIAVAVVIWILLSLAWLIAILSIVVGSFCSNRYERLGSWEDFKERNLSIAPKSIAKSMHLILPWLKSQFKPKDDQETGNNKGNCNCKLWCKCCLCSFGVIVFILMLAMGITLYIFFWIIAITNLCVGLIVVLSLSIVGIILSCVLILTCILISHCCPNRCCGDSCDTCSQSSDHRDQEDCHRCHQECEECCSCFQCSMGCIVVLMTFILILYLPTYLIADNQFPWVCFLPNYNKTKWKWARFGLLIASFCITIPFTAYQLITNKVKPRLNKLNHDYGQSSTSQQQDAV